MSLETQILDYNSIEARDYVLSQGISEEACKKINLVSVKIKKLVQTIALVDLYPDRFVFGPVVKSVQKDLQQRVLNLNNFIEIYPKGNWTEVAIDILEKQTQVVEKLEELLDLMGQCIKNLTER